MILEAIGVKKHFPVSGGFGVGGVRGWIKAVDGVSVGVAEGETLGIVGESGSGKTTLAKMFLLLERPTAGSLRFDGKEIHAFGRRDLARYRRSVQAVFQDPYSSLNPRMRIEHIVAGPLPRTSAWWKRSSWWASSAGPPPSTLTSSAEASASGSRSPGRW
jgi:ABC-type glutathione transport system ATPase component